MVGAQVGDGPHLGIFVLMLGLVVLLGDVVDTVVVIGHWSLVSLASTTFLLHLSLFLAVAASNVGVPRSIGAALLGQIRTGPLRFKPVVPSSNCGHLLDLFLS